MVRIQLGKKRKRNAIFVDTEVYEELKQVKKELSKKLKYKCSYSLTIAWLIQISKISEDVLFKIMRKIDIIEQKIKEERK